MTPKNQATATAIVAMFTAALGAPPREDESPHRIRIEADVPLALSEAARTELLRFLMATGVTFGHSQHKDGTSTIWAEVESRPASRPGGRA